MVFGDGGFDFYGVGVLGVVVLVAVAQLKVVLEVVVLILGFRC